MFRDTKPAFGTSSTPSAFGSFGSNNMNSSPFSQSTFGKTTTSNFTAPGFGTGSTSLFGANTSTAGGGLFGGVMNTPVFGATTTTTQSPGFAFGTNTTSNNLFANQQNANTSMFGANTSAFGQNKPAFGGFGTANPGLFGQQQQQQPQTSALFGQTSTGTGTGLFGSAGGFTNTTNQTMGTPIKFVPTTGTDTLNKGGVSQSINIRHQCITSMKEYENKSLEELRLEDYALNRKGPQPATQQAGLFGASAQPSLFGAATSTSAGGTNLFGENKSLFAGGTSMGFGSNTGVFGSTTPQAGSMFSKPAGFGTVTTTTASGFSFNTPSTPFGSTVQQKQFGAVAPQTNLFGTPSTQPSAFVTQNSAFGVFGGQPNQSIGLFNKAPFGANTTSTGFTFGQNTATNQTSNIFAKPATGTSFGSTAFGTTPGFGTSGSMFGTNQNTSLFNQPSFGKTNSGFAFGSQTSPATSTLGAPLGSQSLFGSPANKPVGLFGSGMFGGGTTSGFGTSSSFGTGSGLFSGLGGQSLLGGSTANASTNQQGNVSVHEQILALASMPFGDNPLFRNLLPASSKGNDLLKPSSSTSPKVTLMSPTVSNQYKVSPRSTTKGRIKSVSTAQLSKKALFDGLDEDVPAQLENFSPIRSTKRLVLKTKPLDIEGSSTITTNVGHSFQESDKENNEINSDQTHSEDLWLLGRGSNSSKDDSKNGETKSPRRSIEMTPDASELRTNKFTKSALNSENSHKERSNESSSGSDESREGDETPLMREQQSHPTGIVLNRVGYYTIPSFDELATLLTEDGKCIVDNFTVGREGYGNVYFSDSFDVAGLNLDEIVHFRHKEIVIYPDDDKKPPVGEGLNRKAQVTLDRVWPIDKTTHDPITDPERLQEMRYEDKLQRVCAKLQTRFLEYRPQTGSWVFKVDHFSKYGLSDSDEDDALPPTAGKLPTKPGVPLQPGVPPGSPPPTGLAAPPKQVVGKENSTKQMAGKEETGGLVGSLLSGGLNSESTGLVPVLLEEDQDMEDVPKESDLDYENEAVISSPTVKLARELGSSSHKLQLMKASFFMEDEMSTEFLDVSSYDNHLLRRNIDEVLKGDMQMEIFPEKRYNLLRTQFTSPQTVMSDLHLDGDEVPHRKIAKLMVTQEFIPPPTEHPKTLSLKYHHQLLQWKQTSSYRIGAKSMVDMNLFRGQSFRVGWGGGNTLLTLSTQKAATVHPLIGNLTDLVTFTSGRLHDDDYSPCIVERLRISGGGIDYNGNFYESIEGHLSIQLSHSEVVEESGCPHWKPHLNVEALHAHCNLAVELASDESDGVLSYARQVWELCVALWGNLPSLDEDAGSSSHHTVMARREAVSDWLEKVIMPLVQEETARICGKSGDPNDLERHLPAVFSYLSAKNLIEACEKSQSCDDYYSVMLLSQMGGSQLFRQLINRQMVLWQEVHADEFMNRERLKLFTLIAGLPLFPSSQGTINICENLEWKRCFALHLWYICSPVASIMDALQKYDNAFNAEDPKNNYARPPNPPYIDPDEESETSSGQPIYDMCYHLLRLYSAHSYSLDKLLNPATHTADPLDYRLSWLVFQVLTSLGYTHLSEYSAAYLHTSFALQLESQGLWHWAIFILMHLKNSVSRKAAVLDMLGRHIQLSDCDMYLDKEDFLTEKLKIPLNWIYEAKATLANVQQQYSKAAWYLIKAGHLNEGHEIIMKHIAADCVINENYKYLRRLLEPLVETGPVNKISGWNAGGQILWDYLEVLSEIEKLMAKTNTANDYQLEMLHPLLTSLCTRINLLPCPTAKDRLCQSEIALRTAHLVRNVLQLQKGENKVCARVLAHVINQLPLPEDCICDELNEIVRTVVDDFVQV